MVNRSIGWKGFFLHDREASIIYSLIEPLMPSRCPDLVLINGEDLTPYRAASKSIMALLGRFGTVERY